MKLRLPTPQPAPDRSPYELKGDRRVLILSDIHIPFHDVDSIEAAVDWARRERGVTDILINGDLCDFYQLSSFTRDPRERSVAEELTMAAELVGELARAFKGAEVHLKLGNHEQRFTRYIQTKAPDLTGLDALTLEAVFRNAVPDVHIVEDWRVIKLGKLVVVHGHEVGRGSGGQHPAKWLQAKAQRSSLCGHFHRTDEWTTKDALGQVRTSWSVGCLCNLEPDYLPRNQWNHGAALVDVDKAGEFHVHNVRISGGRVL